MVCITRQYADHGGFTLLARIGVQIACTRAVQLACSRASIVSQSRPELCAQQHAEHAEHGGDVLRVQVV